MRYIMSCVIFALSVIVVQADDAIPLVQIDDGLWLADESTSVCISADTLIALNNLIAENTTECAAAHNTRPIVVRFVDADSTERFPDGTEGYAGMASFATWECDDLASSDDERMSCQLTAADPVEPPDEVVVVVLVTEQETAGAIFGYLTHELTHAYGTTDGERCPYYADDDTSAEQTAACCDAYWWYGVEAKGMFNYTPIGLVQDAISDSCDDSDDPALCHELADLLAQFEQDTCP